MAARNHSVVVGPERKLFRPEALDRLTSPDNLERLIPVTRSLDWLVIAVTALLLTCVAVSCVIGRVPTIAAGRGVKNRSFRRDCRRDYWPSILQSPGCNTAISNWPTKRWIQKRIFAGSGSAKKPVTGTRVHRIACLDRTLRAARADEVAVQAGSKRVARAPGNRRI